MICMAAALVFVASSVAVSSAQYTADPLAYKARAAPLAYQARANIVSGQRGSRVFRPPPQTKFWQNAFFFIYHLFFLHFQTFPINSIIQNRGSVNCACYASPALPGKLQCSPLVPGAPRLRRAPRRRGLR